MNRASVVALLLAAGLLAGCGTAARRPAPSPAPAPVPATSPPAPAPVPAVAPEPAADPLATQAQKAAATGTADGWNDYGYALARAGRWAESAEACRKALALEPSHAYARYNLGWAEYQLGQYLAARTHLGASEAAQNYQRWETRYALGLVAEALGEKSRAAVDFEAAAQRAGDASQAPAEALERVREHLPLPLPPPEGWKVYENARYGYRFFYPADWISGSEPMNDEKQTLASPDGLAELVVWGRLFEQDRPIQPIGLEDRPFMYGYRRSFFEQGTLFGHVRAYRKEQDQTIEYSLGFSMAGSPRAEQYGDTAETIFRSFRITFGNAYYNY